MHLQITAFSTALIGWGKFFDSPLPHPKNATAGPGSDIDILVHFNGNEEQREELLLWLEGWSLSLVELNYQRTGYKSDGLLDVHSVTDEDIKNLTSYALKIEAVTVAAKPLSLRTATN